MEPSQTIVNINSTDPAALLAFYRDVIGVRPHPDENRESTLVVGDTEIVFDGHSELSGAAKQPPRILTNFMTHDVAATQQRLEADGVRFLGPPSTEMIAFATFVDPDGNYGQFFSMPGPPPGTEGFALMVHSPDPDLLREFYRNVVGLSDDHPDLGNPFIAGGTSIYVGPHSEVSGPTLEPARFILNFFVDDVAAEQRRLEGKGVKFLRTQGREYWGGVISTFADPDGNYLQLIQFKPE